MLPSDQGTPDPGANFKMAGEALAAVTGIFPKKAITPKQGEQAEQLVAAAAKLVARFVKFEAFDEFEAPEKRDFEKTYAALSQLTNEEVATATELIASPDIVNAWRFAVNASRAFLKESWPVAIRRTPTVQEWIEPSVTEGGRILSAVAVVDDPLILLREMLRGQVTPSAIEAVKTCHGSLFQRILGLFDTALKEAGQKGKVCPWAHEAQLRLLFEIKPDEFISFRNDKTAEPPEPVRRFDIKFEDFKTKGQATR